MGSHSILILLSNNYEMFQNKFSIKWKYCIPPFSSGLSDVFPENDYSDVTLVSDDKIPFQAHRYVLSASSPVLKNILLDNTDSNPLIYLRGVNHQDLESILQFIYLGEASFYHSNMNRFIQVAKNLQIKQLAETNVTGNSFYTQEESLDNNDMESRHDDISNQDMHANSEDVAVYER